MGRVKEILQNFVEDIIEFYDMNKSADKTADYKVVVDYMRTQLEEDEFEFFMENIEMVMDMARQSDIEAPELKDKSPRQQEDFEDYYNLGMDEDYMIESIHSIKKK